MDSNNITLESIDAARAEIRTKGFFAKNKFGLVATTTKEMMADVERLEKIVTIRKGEEVEITNNGIISIQNKFIGYGQRHVAMVEILHNGKKHRVPASILKGEREPHHYGSDRTAEFLGNLTWKLGTATMKKPYKYETDMHDIKQYKVPADKQLILRGFRRITTLHTDRTTSETVEARTNFEGIPVLIDIKELTNMEIRELTKEERAKGELII
ncbi:MAG: hypothetical protein FWD89_01355 [Firmicutes bacterium]|nr:hypothetical protein [Bacillota bacterium]MCL2770939.1 hypothetical protein [Bacillota bacterium]